MSTQDAYRTYSKKRSYSFNRQSFLKGRFNLLRSSQRKRLLNILTSYLFFFCNSPKLPFTEKDDLEQIKSELGNISGKLQTVLVESPREELRDKGKFNEAKAINSLAVLVMSQDKLRRGDCNSPPIFVFLCFIAHSKYL